MLLLLLSTFVSVSDVLMKQVSSVVNMMMTGFALVRMRTWLVAVAFFYLFIPITRHAPVASLYLLSSFLQPSLLSFSFSS
jgi:hypothetical protein